ncbi:signal recognition particle-docking protein FtsY [Phaeospirillum tilakii]|uniref:Signal recognition particle receptor FtsY n=1 Tax=Phaeospirillum tilakii TaxID=741673 RepID=A0ABW5CC48_9PROT
MSNAWIPAAGGRHLAASAAAVLTLAAPALAHADPGAALLADLATLTQPGRLDPLSLSVGIVLAGLPLLLLLVATRRMLGTALQALSRQDEAGERLLRGLLAEPDAFHAWVGERELRPARLTALLGLDDEALPPGFAAVLGRLTPQDSARLDLAVRHLRGDGLGFEMEVALRQPGRRLHVSGLRAPRGEGRERIDLLLLRDLAPAAVTARAAAPDLDTLLGAPAPAAAPAGDEGWFGRMRAGLSKSSSRLTQGLADLFTKRKLDDEALEDLQDLLITADLGVGTVARVTEHLSKTRLDQDITAEEIKTILADQITAILEPVARPLEIDPTRKPHVVLVVGVNGAGKTTTIGKLATQYKQAGLAVSLAAGDTFRAAAVEQLKVWGERTGCPVIARDTGADAAALAFDAVTQAGKQGDDLLFIDTAGRLQNKSDLMAELAKLVRSIKKVDETAPHSVLLVLDATVGQNAHSQVETFRDMVAVTGLVLTKLDGTARGGVLVALAEKFGLPVHAIGVGEQAADLRPFDPRAFAQSLVGMETK